MPCHHFHIFGICFRKDGLDDTSRSFPLRSLGLEYAIPKDRSTDLESCCRLAEFFETDSVDIMVIDYIHGVYDTLIQESLFPCLAKPIAMASVQSLEVTLPQCSLALFVQIVTEEGVGMGIPAGSEAACLLPFYAKCHISTKMMIYERYDSQSCSPGKAKHHWSHCRVSNQGWS